MAKTNTELIRELDREVASQKTQIEWLKNHSSDIENRLREIEPQLTRLTEQIDELRRRQTDADTRWRWLMTTFVGLLISLVVASVTLWIKR